ncbi:MAG: hypothetical protein AAGU11_19910, partial [Syntrophobacteraceae bacterium]
MNHLSFSTKAGTLRGIAARGLKSAKVLPLVTVSRNHWMSSPTDALSLINQGLQEGERLIVRSSTRGEDGFQTSNAGHFTSISNILRSDPGRIAKAIDKVFASYSGDIAPRDEVLIQPVLPGISMAGVALTADMDTLAPYYIINYNEKGVADAVTSGTKASLATFVAFKHCSVLPPDPRLAQVIDLCRELEEVFGYPFLDVEFAFDGTGDLYLFQVRPLVTTAKEDLSSLDLRDPLLKIHKKVEKLTAPHPNLLGEKAIFGVMPDWNPAEIIGQRPRQLALSLYKELVTDNIWAYQRDRYGYRNLRSHPLMASFLGMPYIDVRVDFNSFIPASLDERIAEKLVKHYLSRLQQMPHLHDKVEFEIVHSCYYLNLPERLEELLSCGFSRNELKRIEFSLLELTNTIVAGEGGFYRQDLKRIETLRQRHAAVMTAELPRIDTIYWLVEECKRYGTLPFAGIARAAFIAVQFLKSFVAIGILTEDDYHSWMNSLSSIAKRLSQCLAGVGRGEVSREEFLSDFGHLRPGTYDILSPRYDECFEIYFPVLPKDTAQTPTFTIRDDFSRLLDATLAEHGIRCSAEQLLSFIREAIEGREYAKFVFTQTLSEIIRQIEMLGAQYSFSKDDLSYLDIRAVLNLYASLDHLDVKTTFEQD